ncbi:hypothetical protein V5P93_003757 [Actinokineospora auranticolor]|uniref:hypothetical protein n=1 Tax=Actinokineospora auranticolor TaxID=155976 RepID=UPI0011B03A83|nr:hypothetical protein [Actinokineospora auranticolor]
MLTCRSAEYEKLNTEHAPPNRAAVVEIKTIEPHDTGFYLHDNKAEGELTLAPGRQPHARRRRQEPRRGPVDTADQGADAVKRRVLVELLPAVYARTEAGWRAYPAEKADRLERPLYSR